MQGGPSLMISTNELAGRNEYTISDLARMHDVSLRTLRFYEDKGLLHPRRQGTARYYSPADRIRLELILKGKRLGFTLAEIFDLIASREKQRTSGASGSVDAEETDLTVSLQRHQIEAQIAHLERQRNDLDAAIKELHEANARMLVAD